MGLLDIFTGAPGVAAADQNKALLQGAQTGIADRTQATKNMAGGYLNTGYDQAGGALGQGYGAAQGAINTGAQGAQGYLQQGAGNAVGTLQAGGGAYAPLTALAGQYGKGANLYADALGINGQQGNANATSAFQAGPGYDFTLNQGINSLSRLANAQGQGVGGNVNRSAIDYATGLANNTFNNWRDALGGYNNLQLGATQGAAAGNQANNQSIANIQNMQGQNQAGVATGQGSSLADLARGYYGGQAGLDTSRGGALAGNEIGANQTITGADLNLTPQIAGQNTAAANAQMAGSGNLWNFGLNAAKLAAGVGGGAAGAGASGGSSFLPSSSFMNNSWGW